MLAGTLNEIDLPNLRFPLILQPKLDGIRCCIVEGKALSRKLKRIPNRFVREKLEQYQTYPVLVDGELIIEGKTFNETQSAIMSEDEQPDFIYKIFDYLHHWNSVSFLERSRTLHFAFPLVYAKLINSIEINNLQQLLEWEKYIISDKYEGIILRSPEAPYKFGRSTLREQALLKFKRFQDSEAVILDSFALEVNTNTPTLDNLGYTEHSDHQAGKIKTNMLGSWYVRDINPDCRFFGKYFYIGSGFTNNQRLEFWKNREQQKGEVIKYKYQAHGSKILPRTPIWLGFRKDI